MPEHSDRLAEIRARLEAAPKGTWYWEPDFTEEGECAILTNSGDAYKDVLVAITFIEPVAVLLTWLPDDLPWLLAEVERLRAENKRLRERGDYLGLELIEARNPGIDMDEVRAVRQARAAAEPGEECPL